MKKLPLLLLLFAAACSSKNHSGSTDPNAVTVSMNGIGDLKIGMKQESVEKLLKHKLSLPNLTPDSITYYFDTVACKYKDVDYRLVFNKEWQEDSTYDIKLFAVSSQSSLLKTPSGISIGDDIHRIIDAYPDRRLSIDPAYDYSGNKPVRVKGKTDVLLFDYETANAILFSMNENKVETMNVTYYEGD